MTEQEEDPIRTLAEHMFLSEIDRKGKTLGDCADATIQKWVIRAENAIKSLDKMNLAIINKDKKIAMEGTTDKTAGYIVVIKQLVSELKSTKPEHFPCQELAHRIVNHDKGIRT